MNVTTDQLPRGGRRIVLSHGAWSLWLSAGRRQAHKRVIRFDRSREHLAAMLGIRHVYATAVLTREAGDQ